MNVLVWQKFGMPLTKIAYDIRAILMLLLMFQVRKIILYIHFLMQYCIECRPVSSLQLLPTHRQKVTVPSPGVTPKFSLAGFKV